MRLFDILRSPINETSKNIERSLEGIQLGTPIENFENNPDWYEITGPEKAMFESGLSGERLFATSHGTPRMCGCVFDKVYKISVMISPSEGNSYLKEFMEKYGRPSKPRKGWYAWDNENVNLEFILGGPQTNIMLTDKQLLMKAHGL